MKYSFLVIVLAVTMFLPLAAQTSLTELVPPGNWSYDAFEYLFLETGSISPAADAPATKEELKEYFDLIPYDKLSSQGQAVYTKLQEFLSPRDALITSGMLSFDIRPVVSITACGRGTGDAYFGFDNIERYNHTHPLFSLPLLLGVGPWISAYSDITLKEGYWASSSVHNFTNIPLGADAFDLNMPSTAYIAGGNSYLTAIIGRGSLESGRTLTGSMILSDNADRLDYAMLVFHSPKIRFSFTPIELAPERFAYFHELTIRPFRCFSIKLSETATVNSTLDLRYCNPFMVYHNYAGWRDNYGQPTDTSPVGTQFAVSADFVPVRGLRLYGQYVMNQFQTTYELELSESARQIPNSLGGLAGVEYAKPFKKGYLSATIEGVYANPWLYIMSTKGISYYWSRKEQVAPSGYTTSPVEGWLGSPFGPDTIACTTKVMYDVPLMYSMAIQYRFITKGDNGDAFFASKKADWYPASVSQASITTPSGDTAFQHSISVSGTRFIRSGIEVEGKVGYSVMYCGCYSGSVDADCTVIWHLR